MKFSIINTLSLSLLTSSLLAMTSGAAFGCVELRPGELKIIDLQLPANRSWPPV